MTDFHATRMGARFDEITMPAHAAAIERLAVAVERLTDARSDDGPGPEPQPPEPKDSES
jgi:hypothetical protein